MESRTRTSRLGQWFRRAGSPYLAFAVAAVCFFGATFYTDRRVRELADVSVVSSQNALPSVLHLSAIRAELRTIERGAGGPEIDDALRAMSGHVDAYLHTAMFPNEGALWSETEPQLERLRTSAAALRARQEANDHPGANAALAGLRAAIPSVDAQLEKLVDLNAANGALAARRFEVLESRITETAFALDALSFFFALCATALAYRAARRYARFLEQRTCELERFADRVAHDIRSPLSPALMALTIVSSDLPEDHPRQRVLARGVKSLRLATSIIEGLLAFARSGARPSSAESTSVGEGIRGVLEEAAGTAAASNVELAAESFEEMNVACAPGVRASILSNLVNNAIKHMGDRKERRIVVRVVAEKEGPRIEVEDSGPGIPAEVRDTVFDPYVRLDAAPSDGLGLGLATVRRLVEAHGGRVGVFSEPGRTRFWFLLPRAGGGAGNGAPLVKLPASPAS